jgi:hypothetical protein
MSRDRKNSDSRLFFSHRNYNIVIKKILYYQQQLILRILGFLFFISLLIHPSYGAESNEIKGPNISGLVTVPEPISVESIKAFSTAEGKVTEIKNNSVLVLKNKDMGVKISGFIQDAPRGEKVRIIILRPDDSVYATGAFLNDHSSYIIPAKLHTKWVEGSYEILVKFIDSNKGTLRFCITDEEPDKRPCDIISYKPEIISKISKYLDGMKTREELVSDLQEIEWSKSRIDNFIVNNTPEYNPYAFLYLGALLPLFYILVSILSKEKNQKIKQQRSG